MVQVATDTGEDESDHMTRVFLQYLFVLKIDNKCGDVFGLANPSSWNDFYNSKTKLRKYKQ